MKQLTVLIACEESQAECKAWRSLGHEAYSCDIKHCKRDGHPEWHIMGDVTQLLDGVTTFATMDGVQHIVESWNLIIAHPPCTYLCKVSSVHMRQNGRINAERFELMKQARDFFFRCLGTCTITTPVILYPAILVRREVHEEDTILDE